MPAALAWAKAHRAQDPGISPAAQGQADQLQQQAVHRQQQAVHQQVAELMHQHSQQDPEPAEQQPTHDTDTHDTDMLEVHAAHLNSGSLQGLDHMMGSSSAEGDAVMGTPDTDSCSMEHQPMSPTAASGSAANPQGDSDDSPMSAEHMTQDHVIADTAAENSGLPPVVQIGSGVPSTSELYLSSQLYNYANSPGQMLQLDLSPDAAPATIMQATNSNSAGGGGGDGAAPLECHAVTSELGVQPSSHADVLSSNHAADAGHADADTPPMDDTLPDSCPSLSENPAAADVLGHPPAAGYDELNVCATKQPPFVSLLVRPGSLSAPPAPAASTVHLCPNSTATAPTAALATGSQTVIASATNAGAAAATTAAVASAAPAANGGSAEAVDPVDGDDARAEEPALAPGAANAGQLQQLLLHSHVPHEAVTAFLWSAVLHIVPQVRAAPPLATS